MNDVHIESTKNLCKLRTVKRPLQLVILLIPGGQRIKIVLKVKSLSKMGACKIKFLLLILDTTKLISLAHIEVLVFVVVVVIVDCYRLCK